MPSLVVMRVLCVDRQAPHLPSASNKTGAQPSSIRTPWGRQLSR